MAGNQYVESSESRSKGTRGLVALSGFTINLRDPFLDTPECYTHPINREKRRADRPVVVGAGGTTGSIRAAQAALPDLPTAKEAGMPDFQASAWNGLFAPKGTPKPIVDKLSDALDKALGDDYTRKRLLELGSDIADKARRGQQPLAALVKSEIAKWTPVIQAAGPSPNTGPR